MKSFTTTLLLLVFLLTFSTASAVNDVPRIDEDLFHSYLAGNYLLIGKAPDSEKTFHGEVTIKENGSGELEVTRSVGGTRTRGGAWVGRTVLSEALVLRMNFSDADIAYEATCLWRSDLDNYARISCYIYRQDGTTVQPGLEALFHDTPRSAYDD